MNTLASSCFFYANDHEPIHVHGEYAGCEIKAEIVVVDRKVVEIRYVPVRDRRALPAKQMRYFRELVEYYAEEIVEKWIDFFIRNKTAKPVRITQRVR